MWLVCQCVGWGRLGAEEREKMGVNEGEGGQRGTLILRRGW